MFAIDVNKLVYKLSQRYLCGEVALTELKNITPMQIIGYQAGFTPNELAVKRLVFIVDKFENSVVAINDILSNEYKVEKFLAAHQCLSPDSDKFGRYRNGKAWIGSGDIESAAYIAPDETLVSGLVNDFWRRYLSSSQKIHNALQLYNDILNTHPFVDGNGRIARAFLSAFVLKQGDNPIHPDLYRLGRSQDSFIASIRAKTDRYYNENDKFTYWNELKSWREKTYNSMEECFNKLKQDIAAKLTLTILSNVDRKVLEFIVQKPCFNPLILSQQLNEPPERVSESLLKLESQGIIEKCLSEERRYPFYVSEIVLNAYECAESFIFKNK